MTKWRIEQILFAFKTICLCVQKDTQIYYWHFSQKAMSIIHKILKTSKLDLLTWWNTILDGPQVIRASEDSWGVCYDGERARLRNLA